jgi:hypothetical protein
MVGFMLPIMSPILSATWFGSSLGVLHRGFRIFIFGDLFGIFLMALLALALQVLSDVCASRPGPCREDVYTSFDVWASSERPPGLHARAGTSGRCLIFVFPSPPSPPLLAFPFLARRPSEARASAGVTTPSTILGWFASPWFVFCAGPPGLSSACTCWTSRAFR